VSIRKKIEHSAMVIDYVAAGLLGLITIVIFASALFRYLFTTPIPDGFDISRLLLGSCILWGLASVSYRGGHISVDAIWTILSPRKKRWMDITASLFTLAFIGLFAWMLFNKVLGVYDSNEETFDLRIQVWPFYAMACGGVFVATLTTLARLVLEIVGHPPEEDEMSMEAYEHEHEEV